MNNVPKTLTEAKTLLENKMVEVLAVLEARYKKSLPIPEIVLKPLGKRAGVARHNQLSGEVSIHINSDMINEKYWEMQLNDTIGHEVCHHVAPLIYNRWIHGPDKTQGWSHGRAWKECMRAVGLKPERCFVMEDTSEIALRVVKKNYGYTCGCPNHIHFLTKTLHNRIMLGRHRKCCRCNVRLKYAGEKRT